MHTYVLLETRLMMIRVVMIRIFQNDLIYTYDKVINVNLVNIFHLIYIANIPNNSGQHYI